MVCCNRSGTRGESRVGDRDHLDFAVEVEAGRLPAKRLGPKTIRIASEDLAALEWSAPVERQVTPMSIDQFKQRLTTPPSPEEHARRRAVVERTLEHRKNLVITPLTTADLIHRAREEEARSRDLDR